MSITRLDMMTMAPKANEATGVKVNQNQKPVNEQIVINNQMQKTIQHNNQQTIRKADVDNPEYRYDAKEKGNNKYKGQKKKDSQKKEEKEKNSKYGYIGEHHIDISI